jgi:two-component system sensor histidine kinase KdpD
MNRGDRPDPDALLRRVQEEEAQASNAKLKIFFGFAPGVGKTYRMLQVARDLVAEQKLDVVVGLVETHRRWETAAMLLGLELLPRRKVEYRGRTLEEFDLDAALVRRPALLLLDELAHSNAPGSRHTKRWQDVLELLDAGIDVFTTVNVQHVESLNDVVAQNTRIQVRETIPDSMLDRADEIELVDIAPEELLARLREGKVYLPEQAQRAAQHFFQRGNLLALRELALRRTAQHVDEEVREYREQHGVVTTWPAGERILVCVGAAPSSARLIRAGCRMAAGLRAPWEAVYVDAAAIGGLSAADHERLESHLNLAESLGATVVRLSGAQVPSAILTHARKHNVTRIVVGKPTHSRLRDRLRGSLLDALVRGSGDIDIHVISGDTDDGRSPAPAGRRPVRSPPGAAYPLAAGLIAITTGLGVLLQALAPVPDVEVLYLLAIMITAMRFGRGPALVAAAIAVAAYDFFFVPPYLTFAVADARYLLTFAMMFLVGILLSELTARIRRQEHDAIGREERTGALYALSRDLSTAQSPSAVADVVAQHVSRVFAAPAFVLRPGEGDLLEPAAARPDGAALDARENGVAKWTFEHGRPAGLGTDTLPGSRTVCVPLQVSGRPVGVIALQPVSGQPLDSDQRAFLAAFARQAGLALERARLVEENRNAVLRARTEEMRSSLLSAVSHDLRTPLAAITGAASSLAGDEGLASEVRDDLVATIREEADRLEHLVSNLLDMTRLEAGALPLRREWVPLEELVGAALTRLEPLLGTRPVEVRLPRELPLLSVDPVLFAQVFVNLLENASKYTPAAAPIEISARVEPDAVVVELSDRGPGLPAGSEEKIFDKFFRGAHTGIGGVGLGLAICRGIVQAHDGTIAAANRPGGGATFRIRLPRLTPPALPPATQEAA